MIISFICYACHGGLLSYDGLFLFSFMIIYDMTVFNPIIRTLIQRTHASNSTSVYSYIHTCEQVKNELI